MRGPVTGTRIQVDRPIPRNHCPGCHVELSMTPRVLPIAVLTTTVNVRAYT